MSRVQDVAGTVLLIVALSWVVRLVWPPEGEAGWSIAGLLGGTDGLVLACMLVVLCRQMLLEQELRGIIAELRRKAARPPAARPRAAAAAGARSSGQQSLRRMREWQERLASGSWEPMPSFRDTEGRGALMTQDPTSRIPTVRIQCELKVPKDYFVGYVTAVHAEDLALRMRLEPTLQELRTVEEASEEVTVSYSRISAPGLLGRAVSQRDAVYEMRRAVEDETTTRVCVSSVEHPACPPRPDAVRGDTQTYYCIRSTGADTCAVEFAASFDPKGSIPSQVLHLFKGKSGTFFLNLRKLLEQRYRDNVPCRHGAPPPRQGRGV